MFYRKPNAGNKSSYSTINLFFRSLIFSTYSVSTMILYSFVCLATSFFSLEKRQAILRAYLRVYIKVLKKICLIDYRLEGLENIPQDRRGIIMSKHQSTWEGFFLPLLFINPAVIVKRELLWIPFFGWGLALADPISINRRNQATAMQQIISKGQKCLEKGRWILIFPEGTRIPPGKIGHYRLGGARLAVATEAPVIPIAHNAGEFWPRRKFIKRPGTITLVVGPPIESVGKTPEEVLAQTKDWIETTMRRIEGVVYKSASQ